MEFNPNIQNQPPAPEQATVMPTGPAPFVPEPTQPDAAPAPEVKPPRKPINKKALVIGLGITLMILFLSAIGGVYYWQHGIVTRQQADIKTIGDGNTKLRLQLTHIQEGSTAAAATQSPTASTSDEQVLAAVKNYCNANVDPATKKPLVLKVGTAGAAQKQVLYSADKNFAYVNAVCSKDGAADGSGAAYYLKKVNDAWVFLYRGQAASPEYSKQFNIPTDFK